MRLLDRRLGHAVKNAINFWLVWAMIDDIFGGVRR